MDPLKLTALAKGAKPKGKELEYLNTGVVFEFRSLKMTEYNRLFDILLANKAFDKEPNALSAANVGEQILMVIKANPLLGWRGMTNEKFFEIGGRIWADFIERLEDGTEINHKASDLVEFQKEHSESFIEFLTGFQKDTMEVENMPFAMFLSRGVMEASTESMEKSETLKKT